MEQLQELPSISYVITVWNEQIELNRLLNTIKGSIDYHKDELVVVHTYRETKEKESYTFKTIATMCTGYIMKYENFHFQNKFADLKNFANNLATKQYIINFDADEFISAETLSLWKNILTQSTNDLLYVPRVNIVSDYTQQDVKQYNWQINERDWINWPDYQPRIFKNNKIIHWSGNLHEQITGAQKAAALPQEPSLAIIHHKTIDKQRQQNELYSKIKR